METAPTLAIRLTEKIADNGCDNEDTIWQICVSQHREIPLEQQWQTDPAMLNNLNPLPRV